MGKSDGWMIMTCELSIAVIASGPNNNTIPASIWECCINSKSTNRNGLWVSRYVTRHLWCRFGMVTPKKFPISINQWNGIVINMACQMGHTITMGYYIFVVLNDCWIMGSLFINISRDGGIFGSQIPKKAAIRSGSWKSPINWGLSEFFSSWS